MTSEIKDLRKLMQAVWHDVISSNEVQRQFQIRLADVLGSIARGTVVETDYTDDNPSPYSQYPLILIPNESEADNFTDRELACGAPPVADCTRDQHDGSTDLVPKVGCRIFYL